MQGVVFLIGVLNTVTLPAIDKFRLFESLKNFPIFQTRFIKFSWFSIF